MTINKILTILAIVLVIILLVVAVLAYFCGFEIDKKINISDIAIAVSTISLAIIIPGTIEKSLEKKRYSRELLIKACSGIQDYLDELYQIICESNDNDGDKYKTLIFNIDRRIGNKISHLSKKIKIEFSIVNIEEITKHYDELKITMTDTLGENDFSFNSSYKAGVFRAINTLDIEMENIKFSINSQ